jgi:SAM-dependent methyltransferase
MGSFSFDAVNVYDYEQLRPSYAREAVEWFLGRATLRPGGRVLDLAAGTGKLTRELHAAGMDVVAVEPSARMRELLASVLPLSHVLDGSAERIPLEDASVDAVTVAQAVHHFRLPDALLEIHRVLRASRCLALFWSVYKDEDPVKIALDAILHHHISPDSAIWAAFGAWPEAFRTSELFAPSGVESFPHPHTLRPGQLSALFATSSDVASLPPEPRRRLLTDLEELARSLPDPVTIAAETRVDLFIRT